MCNLLSTGSVLAYEGHGVPEWRKGVPFFRAMINKNGHVVEYVRAGRVKAKGKITKCVNQAVTFVDGTSDKFTFLIMCTGCEYSYPLLPAPYANRRAQDHYKLIFNPDDPSLLLIGFARPTILSIPFMTELQCLYAFKVISGVITLPDKVTMLQEIQKDNEYRDIHFSGLRRADNLVNPFQYAYDVADLAGANPDYAGLFFENPLMFFKIYFSPMSTAHFLLNDKSKRRLAVQQIWSRQHLDFFIYPFIFLAARLLQVDRFLGAIKRRKYQRQQSTKRREVQHCR
jgi:dimethylaniline monooxygenase (N-oxide forming)